MTNKPFLKNIDNLNMKKSDIKHIKSLLGYYSEATDKKLSSRSYLFYGPPGIGKTYLTESIINHLDKEVIYYGISRFKSPKTKKVCSFEELLDKIDNNRKQIIYLDDIEFLLDKIDDFTIETRIERVFMMILEIVKRNKNKLLVATTNHIGNLDDRATDRFEVKVEFNLPEKESKKEFLTNNYSDYLTPKQIKQITEKTMGYNFRDIPEVLKIAYRLSESKITDKSIEKALNEYKPTNFLNINTHKSIKNRFNEIIGLNDIKEKLKEYNELKNNKELAKKYKITIPSAIFFTGPPGTGKTMTARAYAGESNQTLITLDFEDSSILNIKTLLKVAKQYENCIIFIDEAEKLFGNQMFGEDNSFIGTLNSYLDGIDKTPLKSTILFGINNIYRFGKAIKDRALVLEFKPPEIEERTEFFKIKINELEENIIEIDARTLAQKTNNHTYRQMNFFWNDIIMNHIKTKEKITEKTLESMRRRRTHWTSFDDRMYG